MAALQAAHPTRRSRFTGWRMGWIGAALLTAMALACVGSLPYTLGRASGIDPPTSSARIARRFEATYLDAALLPPCWAPHAPDELARYEALRASGAPTPQPLLGTDRLGRDLLARCLVGGGISIGIGLAAALISVIIGTLYGTLAGHFGGRIDAAMMRFVDVLYGLPSLLIIVLLSVASEGMLERADERAGAMHAASTTGWSALVREHRDLVNVLMLLLAIAAVSWLTMARVIRGQVLSLKAQPFMEACRAIGVPLRLQFTRHLLPNLAGTIVVYATLTVPAAILSESFLSFLGIGVREPLPSWGNLAAEGLGELNMVRVRWWLLVWPCALIAATLLALNLVGEALRAVVDPKAGSAAAPR